MNENTIRIGSELYNDIANSEAGRVCKEFAGEDEGNELYERFCGDSVSGINWPECGTEEEIRAASRAEWLAKFRSAGVIR